MAEMPVYPSRALLALLLAVLGAALIPTGAAAADDVVAELRGEGPEGPLDPGTSYVTGTERVRRSGGLDCNRRPGEIKVPGPTALGIVDSAAAVTEPLDPIRVRPDSFGLFVCEIGGLVGRAFDDPDEFSGWTYWTDFTGGTSAAEAVQLEGEERVLWAFADFGAAQTNTGEALELSNVPAYDADGSFMVTVEGHAFDGTPSPKEGAEIVGATTAVDLGEGEYQVTVPAGTTDLHAEHHPDIPSNRLQVCVDADPAACPAAHGRTLIGSTENDDLAGTPGWDVIRSRGGKDVIDLTDGGSDQVSCGGGTDKVVLNTEDIDDEIADSCEKRKRVAR
jgi:hypothetical protein